MDWKRLLKNQLLILGEELGAEVDSGMKKDAIVRAIEGLNLSSEDIKETWNEIQKQDEQEREKKPADVIARLPVEDADNYDKVKDSLLKRFRLSSDAFRQRFRNLTKKQGSTYSEFAYELKVNLVEWMKGASAFENFEKALEVVALEQFFSKLSEPMKLWIQDRAGVVTVQAAADLADEYASRRGERDDVPPAKAGDKGKPWTAKQGAGAARVVITGPFGEVETEAAVSDKLPSQPTVCLENKGKVLRREQSKL
ncbi:hypothetical protein HPB48_018774 [Haemaphysalis longicornis]|uniref:SCAN box domain-containing protein n=1 Tax=Haemaphysalis longicornis TaxID=44386 RepID=A0A9J6GLW1_HAELO|nr:hypothetical protein HPB48_018774 [Haemaphysalis longicornis]